jgi:hypothetical protein
MKNILLASIIAAFYLFPFGAAIEHAQNENEFIQAYKLANAQYEL